MSVLNIQASGLIPMAFNCMKTKGLRDINVGDLVNIYFTIVCMLI